MDPSYSLTLMVPHWDNFFEATWFIGDFQHLEREFPLSWFLNLLILVPQACLLCLQLFTTLGTEETQVVYHRCEKIPPKYHCYQKTKKCCYAKIINQVIIKLLWPISVIHRLPGWALLRCPDIKKDWNLHLSAWPSPRPSGSHKQTATSPSGGLRHHRMEGTS